MGSGARYGENEGSGLFGFILPLYSREAKGTRERKQLATTGECPAPGTDKGQAKRPLNLGRGSGEDRVSQPHFSLVGFPKAAEGVGRVCSLQAGLAGSLPVIVPVSGLSHRLVALTICWKW